MRKILLGIAILLLVTSFSYCQELKQPLQLTIKSDKQVYGLGENIKIKVGLKNVNQEGIYVYTFKLMYFISLIINEGRGVGKELIATEYKMPDDWHHVPEKDDFYFLKPQEIYSVDIENLFTSNIRYKIVKPCIFKIKAVLHLYNDYKSTIVDGREFGIDAWTGTLTSNTITIKVVERKNIAEGERCVSDDNCLKINCSKYDSPVKSGYKSYCINSKCKCMCYGCE